MSNKVHLITIEEVHEMYHDDTGHSLRREIHSPCLFVIPLSWEMQANIDLNMWIRTDILKKGNKKLGQKDSVKMHAHTSRLFPLAACG